MQMGQKTRRKSKARQKIHGPWSGLGEEEEEELLGDARRAGKWARARSCSVVSEGGEEGSIISKERNFF